MKLLLSTGAIAGIAVGAVAAVLLVIAIWAISACNKFVRMKTQCEEAFSNIDIFLKKRFDLIPNLVETVKGYMKHESETLKSITEARACVASASGAAEKIVAEAKLSQAIKGLNIVVENYPDLKANANFIDLQSQLKGIESELANARRYYNATARQFNSGIKSFPALIIARAMHLEAQPYFELDDPAERKNVKVEF